MKASTSRKMIKMLAKKAAILPDDDLTIQFLSQDDIKITDEFIREVLKADKIGKIDFDADLDLYVDGEGISKHRRFNMLAYTVFKLSLYGTVLVVKKKEVKHENQRPSGK
ncbi:MAG TPA: hypothetical protein PKO39_07865 [Bacilli bacterium]|nr:hypothetical protein [Bacilli bacterium]HQC90384.1 hypothetical protein [Bacilli bacterium]